VLVAPDIAATMSRYTTADLIRVLRHGIRPDGTGVLRIMPSEMFSLLSEKDLGSIIAFLRTQTPGNETLPKTHFGPVGRLMLLLYKQDAGTIFAAESIDHERPLLAATPEDPVQLGRYLAMTACTECHGPDLKGSSFDETPPLSIVAAYSLADFSTLMHTGVPVGGRELSLMKLVSTTRFVHFTEAEIAALHGYLSTLVHNP
jgi:mono/diheme cytochrome c family protein